MNPTPATDQEIEAAAAKATEADMRARETQADPNATEAQIEAAIEAAEQAEAEWEALT